MCELLARPCGYDPMNRKHTILLIEDNELNREIASVSLKKAGYAVLETDNGKSGLEVLETREIDLLLLDLSLPDISGWDIISRIRKDEARAALPVIVLTAHAMVGDRERAIRLGCSAYLTKPCLPDKIVKEVKSFLP